MKIRTLQQQGRMFFKEAPCSQYLFLQPSDAPSTGSAFCSVATVATLASPASFDIHRFARCLREIVVTPMALMASMT
jgi:hypothetical protein